jgi:hypothetical protein
MSRYSVSRRKIPIEYNCIGCGKIVPYTHSKRNRYYSLECSAAHSWTHRTIPKILAGRCTGTISLKRYLRETVGDWCSICLNPSTWNMQPLMLQLDHLDGNSDNNSIDNIRLLCPNCHSQTPTYGHQSKGNRYKKVAKRNVYIREYRKVIPD